MFPRWITSRESERPRLVVFRCLDHIAPVVSVELVQGRELTGLLDRRHRLATLDA
jgi:hypothetical protein